MASQLLTEDAQKLSQALLSNPICKAVATAHEVLIPLVDPDEHGNPQGERLNPKEATFLNSFAATKDLEAALNAAEWTLEQLNHFLASEKVKRIQESAQKATGNTLYWSAVDNLVAYGSQILKGERRANLVQYNVWKEFYNRAAPVKKDAPTQVQINITVDPSAVKAALARQNSIETTLVENPGA